MSVVKWDECPHCGGKGCELTAFEAAILETNNREVQCPVCLLHSQLAELRKDNEHLQRAYESKDSEQFEQWHELREARENRKKYLAEVMRIIKGICEHATDTVWISGDYPATGETAVDALFALAKDLGLEAEDVEQTLAEGG